MEKLCKRLLTSNKCLLIGIICMCMPIVQTEAATYQYDNLGRVTVVTFEDGTTVEYQYDSNGNIIKQQTEKIEMPEETFPVTTPDTSKNPITSEEPDNTTEEPDNTTEEPDEESGFWGNVKKAFTSIIESVTKIMSRFFNALFK